MKKSYLILAAVAGLFASCTQEVLVDENVNAVTESPIGFTTFTESQTRAENNSAATNKYDLENYFATPTFDVWAWKYYDGAWVSTAVYNKGTVSYASSAWTADPVKFWDKSAEKYYFYAAAPSDANWTMNNGGGDAGYLTYTDFTLAGGLTNNMSNQKASTDYQEYFKEAASDVDLLIAEDNEVARASYNKAIPDDVNETFDHILSRLNVTIKIKDGSALLATGIDVKVTEFGITGVNLKNKGTFTENAESGTTLSAGTTGRWGTLTTAGTYNLPGYDISSTSLGSTALYIAQYLIIPQAITSEVLDRANGKVGGTTDAAHPYFKLSYTINGEPYTAYCNLANAFGKASGATLDFCEGWQNTLNILIDADIITFDAEVYEWTNKENVDIIIED